MSEQTIRKIESHDPRLARHVRHDPRSRNYPVQPKKLGQLTSVRHHRSVGIYDQGSVGSCTANAACGAVSTAPFGHHIRSQSYIRGYYHQETLTQGGDVYPPADPGSDGLTAAQVAKQRGWITSYQHAFSLEAALTAVEQGGAIFGMEWLTGCDTPDSNGIIKYRGTVRGGHEIEADELDIERQLVGFCNSWSSQWGLGGRFYMTWTDLQRALGNQGDCTLFIR